MDEFYLKFFHIHFKNIVVFVRQKLNAPPMEKPTQNIHIHSTVKEVGKDESDRICRKIVMNVIRACFDVSQLVQFHIFKSAIRVT